MQLTNICKNVKLNILSSRNAISRKSFYTKFTCEHQCFFPLSRMFIEMQLTDINAVTFTMWNII